MSFPNQPNPYAPPGGPGGFNINSGPNLPLPALQKAEAIIKDAGQVWIALVICFLCSLIGSLMVSIWFSVRLSQWNSLASQYPELMQPSGPGTLPARFQDAKSKLFTGMIGGIVLIVFAVIVIAIRISAMQ